MNDSGRPRRRLLLLTLASWAGLALLWLLARTEWFVAEIHGRHVGPAFWETLADYSGRLPVSVAELLLFLGTLLLLVWLVRGIRATVRRETPPLRALARGGGRLIAVASIATFLFYLFWGVQYARRPLAERLGWSDAGQIDPDFLTTLADELIDDVNELYRSIHGSDDGGEPTDSGRTVATWNQPLESGFAGAATKLPFDPTFRILRRQAKPALLSALMSWFGISGYYFPWTGEANVNADIPAWSLPLVIAHEKAHQRGVTHEGEANFVGFLACLESANPHARYAALLFAQRQLHARVYFVSPDLYQQLAERRLPGVRRDIEASREFWHRHQGPAADLGHSMNDAFLKLNQVKGGIRAYRSSADLILQLAQARGGTLK